jgi:hypothetical protein
MAPIGSGSGPCDSAESSGDHRVTAGVTGTKAEAVQLLASHGRKADPDSAFIRDKATKRVSFCRVTGRDLSKNFDGAHYLVEFVSSAGLEDDVVPWA